MDLKKFITLTILALVGILIVITCIIVFTITGRLILANAQEPSSKFTEKEQVNSLFLVTHVKAKDNKQSRSTEFILEIPSIDLYRKVIPNVNPISENKYLEIIKKDIAHGKWTLNPLQVEKKSSGITYLFAHRYGRYAIFERLDEVKPGNLIKIYYHGKLYLYKVISTQIVNPDQIDLYTSQSSIPLVRIQTCENGEKQRLIVDALFLKSEKY